MNRPSVAYLHSQRESKRSKGKIVFVFQLCKGDILGFLKYHLEYCSLLCHINQLEFPSNIPHALYP